MNREQLAHILRAASTIVDDPNILVIGSQSVLATFDEEELPDAATASMEVDLAYFDDPTEDKADAVDGAIGELSPFHEMNGVYAQGVRVRTAVLPEGWRGRVVPWSNQFTGRVLAAFLEVRGCRGSLRDSVSIRDQIRDRDATGRSVPAAYPQSGSARNVA